MPSRALGSPSRLPASDYVAVTCLPAPVSGLRVVSIGHEGTIAALPSGHPCAGEAQVALSGLERTRLVQLSRALNPAFYDNVLAACSAAGIAPSLIEIAEPAVEQVLLAVASGAGVALLPASVESRFATSGTRFRPLAPPSPSCEVAIVAKLDPSATADAFLRLADLPQLTQRRLAAVA